MRFLRSGAIYAIANIASAAVPFLLLPLLTRLLSPAEYGKVVAFGMLVTLCQAMAGLNAHAALGVVWFQRPRHELPAYAATALMVALTSTVIVAGLGAALLALMPQLASGLTPAWCATAAIAAGANVMLQCRLVLLQNQSRALASAVLQFTASTLNVALSLFAVLALGWGGDGRNAGIAAASAVMAVVAVALFLRGAELQWAPTRAQFAQLARFGLPLIVHTLAAVMLATADRWSISIQLDASALGIYGAAAQLGMVMSVLADAFVKAYSPWLYEKLGADRPEDFRVAVGAIYAAMPTFLLSSVLVGLPLLAASTWLLGAKYQAAASVLPWFVLGGAFSGMYMCTSVLFFFKARTALLATVTLSSALLGSSATWLLVGLFGVHGAGMGFALTQAMLALITTTVAMRTFDLPWQRPTAALRAWWVASFASHPRAMPDKQLL